MKTLKYFLCTVFLSCSTLCSFGADSDTTKNFGWVPDTVATEKFVASLKPVINIVSCAEQDNNQDVLLYEPLVKQIQKTKNKTLINRWLKKRGNYVCLRALSQGDVGSCVGNATALCISIRAAYEIEVEHDSEYFLAMGSPEGVYGLAREVGGMLGNPKDGCCGAFAADALLNYGTLWQIVYANEDLTVYDESRCRQFGYRGVGDELKSEAKLHVFAKCQRVQSAEDVWTCLGIGAPTNVCSNVGFNSLRDDTGKCKPSGKWYHSMAVIGRRTLNGQRQFLIQNSWGDSWNQGSYWEDMPFGSFWIDENIMDIMAKQGDSFAYFDVQGFKTEPDNNKDITYDLGGSSWLN